MCKYLYLKQVIMICVGLLSCCLMLALITFYPFDNTFFQSSGDVVFNNIFGRLGALSSDILFFIFGCMAYIFPCIIFFITWSCLLKRRQFNFFDLSFKIIGGIVILFSFCGLIDFFLDDFYYCFSGGIIGYLLRTKIFYLYSDVITNIIFLFFLFLGIILLFGFLWLIRVVDIISIFLNFLFFNSISFISILQSNKYFRLLILYLQGIFFRNIKFRLINRYFIQSKIIYFKCIRDVKRQFYNFFKKTYNYINIQLKYQCKLLNYKKFPILQYKTILNNQIAKNIVLTMEHETCKPAINGSLYISEKKKLLFRNSVLNALPSLDLLSIPVFKKMTGNIENTIQKSKLLELTLLNYHVLAKVVNVLQGPVVTRFELDLAPGVRSSRISHLSRDLARSLSVSHVRVVEVLPGKSYVGLEVPNKEREIVYLRDVLESDKFQLSCNCLTLGFGKDISGNVMIANLGDMPHLLIAGATGSGKSIGINNIIVSILYKARSEDVRFIMIDPKILELSVYEGIPHLLKNVITDMKDAIDVLNWCIGEMERRYKIIASYGVRHLKSYNEQVELHCINKKNLTDNSIVNNSLIDNQVKNDSLILKKLPYIVIIIDEFSDLILSVGKQAELLIVRLSQKARACGMHLILATQRPSVNVITGLIKANIPSRIAFTVSSKIDSYTILDQSGAESLLGKGDMFYLPPYSSIPIRVHGAFISDEEVASVVKYWKNDVI